MLLYSELAALIRGWMRHAWVIFCSSAPFTWARGMSHALWSHFEAPFAYRDEKCVSPGGAAVASIIFMVHVAATKPRCNQLALWPVFTAPLPPSSFTWPPLISLTRLLMNERGSASRAKSWPEGGAWGVPSHILIHRSEAELLLFVFVAAAA